MWMATGNPERAIPSALMGIDESRCLLASKAVRGQDRLGERSSSGCIPPGRADIEVDAMAKPFDTWTVFPQVSAGTAPSSPTAAMRPSRSEFKPGQLTTTAGGSAGPRAATPRASSGRMKT
jgi:hypothetical protein